jgi:hypothetical protein
MESSPPTPQFARAATSAQSDLWHHAIRVAFLTSLVAAATGVILFRLVGLSGWVVVPLLAFGGWLVGCHLPPAAPQILRPGPGGTTLYVVEDSFGDREDDQSDWSDDLAA